MKKNLQDFKNFILSYSDFILYFALLNNPFIIKNNYKTMKKVIFISLLCQITLIFGQGTKNVSQNDDMISNFMRLSTQQQLDTADYYFEMNNYDSALIFLNLLIKTIPHDADIERQYILQNAYHTMSNIYFFFSDYRMVYDLLIKRLFICEKYDFICEKSSTYNNIGLVYGNINQIDMAKDYFLKALNSCSDSLRTSVILYNLGTYEFKNNIDSAYNYLNKAIEVAQQHDNYSLNSFGLYYQYKKQYDSAFYYFRLSLDYSIKNNDIIVKATNFSDLAKLFFEVNNIDSALYYIDLSNKIAFENKFLDRLADNYLTLSEIEKSKGRYKNALKYYETYVSLKDSITNSGVYGSISLIQRQYEVSKTDRQIEELIIDRQIKENTIHYQKIIWYITLGVLAIVCFVLYIFALQKRKINKMYNHLVEKNVEIIELQKTQSDTKTKTEKKNETEKTTKKVLTESQQEELLKSITIIMNTPSIICNTDFTLIKLAELTHSNQKYVSEAINDGLNKNFNSLLNSYRIKEAQKLFAELDPTNYTIENIAQMVGFKSRTSFNEAFKEITKVSPGFYFKSLHKQKN